MKNQHIALVLEVLIVGDIANRDLHGERIDSDSEDDSSDEEEEDSVDEMDVDDDAGSASSS